MEFNVADSSGTDDDIQPSHFDRVTIGAHYTGNGIPVVNSASYPRMQFDMEAQIHQLEQEAYRSVLRAFKAQSDAISWEKEGLITELRKELRVSDDEHRELLTKVNADDIISMIREWRKAQPMHELVPSPTVSATWKKQKTSQSAFGTPMHSLHNQPSAITQPSSWAPSFVTGGTRPKHGPQMPGLPSMVSTRYASTGPTPRGVFSSNYGSMNEPSEAARRDPLIGRKVMTRWPDDNNFYEAVITDYNPQEGRHALVYDRNTPKEAWEWVDLKEIPSEDIRWVGEDPGLSRQTGLGQQGSAYENRENHHGVFPNSGGKGTMRDQLDKDYLSTESGVLRETADYVEILHTDTLVKEVQKVLAAEHPDQLELEKAKKLLKEHEQALMEVISRLGDSDSESDGQRQPPHGQSMDGEERRRNAPESGNSHGPCSEAEAREGRAANGSVTANGSLTAPDNQQEEIVIVDV